MFPSKSVMLFVLQIMASRSELPPVTPCQLSDSTCLKSSAQALLPLIAPGVPELGMEPLDVLEIEHAFINLLGLKLTLDKCHISGFKNAVFDKVNVDMVNKVISSTWVSPLLSKCKYKASGQLLVLPISGDGDITIENKMLQIDFNMQFHVQKNADGKDIIQLQSHKFKHLEKERVYVNLTNLFNGNKQLSDAMLNFINDNWFIIADEFGAAVLKEPLKKVLEILKKYFQSQPLETIAQY